MKKFPSSKEILQAAIKKKPKAGINELRTITGLSKNLRYTRRLSLR
jgi:hypothetical protein